MVFIYVPKYDVNDVETNFRLVHSLVVVHIRQTGEKLLFLPYKHHFLKIKIFLFSLQPSDVPLSGHTVNKFQRPAILQVNIEGFTASKVNVLYYLTVQYEAPIILFQKIHCTWANRLTITGFALAGSSLSRKHGIATFVHDQLKCKQSMSSYA